MRPLGYAIRATSEPTAAEVLLHSYNPEILIADIGDVVPVSNSLIDAAREREDLFLMCYGGDAQTRVSALRTVADEAVASNTTAEELAARCMALLRRPRRRVARWNPLSSSQISLGPLAVDFGRREMLVHETKVDTTRLEFDLFAQLCRRPQDVWTRQELITAVWEPGWIGDTHVVDVHMSNLRRKLRRLEPSLEFIQTVRGVGFRISDDLLAAAAAERAVLHPLVLPA